MMRFVDDGHTLIRSCRPGYPSCSVDAADVDSWLAEAKSMGVKTILCLLDDKQLAFYAGLGPEGLLGHYRQAGFKVVHRPVPDNRSPPVPRVVLAQAWSDYLEAELPMLVHCSAGFDRTGAVVRFIRRKGFRVAPSHVRV